MKLLRFLWYALGLLLYPLRLAFFSVHRFLVFLSKPGARIIVPVLMIAVGMLLRSQIDAVAGELITDAFWDFREEAPEIYDYRIEITFALCFIAAYVALLIVAKVTTPVVGALPAPRAPLVPQRPLTAPEHKIMTVRASVAIGGSGSRFKGELERLHRFMPANALVVLEAGRGSAPSGERAAEHTTSPEREREREQMQRTLPAAEGPVQTEPAAMRRTGPKPDKDAQPQGEPAHPPEPEAAPQAPIKPELHLAATVSAPPAPEPVPEPPSREPEPAPRGREPAGSADPPAQRPSGGPRRPPKRSAPEPEEVARTTEHEAPEASVRTSGPRRMPRRVSVSEPEPER